MDKYKTCSKCAATKPLADFNKKATRKDGHSSYCRDCARVMRYEYSKKKTPYALLTEDQKEANRIHARRWNAANKDRRALAMAMRRAAKKNNGIFQVTATEIKKLQISPCFYCGNPGGEVDHVIPLSKGGRHSIGNLVGCCRTCNSSKNNLFITEWKKKETRPRNLQRGRASAF